MRASAGISEERPRHRLDGGLDRLFASRRERFGKGVAAGTGDGEVGSQEQHGAGGEADLAVQVGIPHARVEHVPEQLARAVGQLDADDLIAAGQIDDQPGVAVEVGALDALPAAERLQAAREELDLVDGAHEPQVAGAVVDERAVERDEQRALARRLLAEQHDPHAGTRFRGRRNRGGASSGQS